MILIAALLVATVIVPAATIDIVAKRDRAVPYLRCGGDLQSGQADSPRADSRESAEYLNLVSEQRAAATEAIKVVQEFLVNPNSLDQQTRTEFLRALALVQSSAEAAAALVPPPELVSLHHRHVDALVTLATVGDLYLAGMDTHDPTLYERASNGLVRGSELLAAVGNEIECLPLPNGTHNTLDNTFQRIIVDLGVRADRFEHLGQSYAKLTQAKGARLRHVDGARGGTDDARLLPPFFPGIRAVCRNVGKG